MNAKLNGNRLAEVPRPGSWMPSKVAQRGIRWRLAALPLGLALAFIIGSQAWFLIGRSGAIAEAHQRLQAIADLKAAQIAYWYKERKAAAEVISQSPMITSRVGQVLAAPAHPPEEADVVRWLRALQAEYELKRVALYDSTGRLRVIFPPGDEAPYVRAGGHVQVALAATNVVLNDLHRGADDTEIHLSFWVPIRSRANSPLAEGALMLQISPYKFLFPSIQSWPVASPSAEAVIFRRDGDEVVFLNDLRHRTNTALGLRLAIDRNPRLPAVMAVQGHTGQVQGVDYRGVRVLAFTRAITDTPWFLATKVDLDEVLAPHRARAWEAGVLAMALSLVAVMGAKLARRRREARFLQHQLAAERERLGLAQEISEKEARFRKLLEMAPLPLCCVTKEGVITFRNERFVQVFGYAAEEVPTLAEWWPRAYPDPQDRHRLSESWDAGVRRAASDGKDIGNVEYKVTCKDGEERIVAISGIMLGEEILTIFIDLTERKQAEAEIHRLNQTLEQRVVERTGQLEAANNELEAFSYSVSHDLRAPLRAIDGFAQILAQDHTEQLDLEARRLLGVIRSEAARMGQLIDDLLTFSRISQCQVHSAEINMTVLARTAFEECAAQVPERKLGLSMTTLLPARGDPAMIRQVLTNLLSNAIKYSKPRAAGEIELESRLEANECIYCVKDNGVGFDPRYAGKLFGVFQRLHSDEEFEGNGVGLALVQRIIHRHGGRTWAEGKVNAGASFYFTLPNGEQPL